LCYNDRKWLGYYAMKDKILDMLKKNKGFFVSGQDISRQIGITRAAVWKYIKQLQNEGYLIESVSKNGYKLLNCPDLLTYEEMKENLRTSFIGRKIIHFESIGSTNNKARELAEKGEEEGTVVVSESQTGGKGRTGRQWFSQAYKGIWMSVILRPEIDLLSVSFITQITCAAVGKSIKYITGDIRIKWPNDVYLHGKKICGILTESSGEVDKVDYIVLGIGINVNQDEIDFPEILEQKATSIKIETGRPISRSNLLCEVLYELEQFYMDYKDHGSIESVIEFCRTHSSIIGKQIVAKRGGIDILLKVMDINGKGELSVQFSDGHTDSIRTGDIVQIIEDHL
jgi:BirA family biotin operon repressor/biotin-[acetyl-CoA-carboxylase] ligase